VIVSSGWTATRMATLVPHFPSLETCAQGNSQCPGLGNNPDGANYVEIFARSKVSWRHAIGLGLRM
jgi:hypothetical protein